MSIDTIISKPVIQTTPMNNSIFGLFNISNFPVPWLEPTETSTLLLLAQVTGAVPGQYIVRYIAVGGVKGEGGGGHDRNEELGRTAMIVQASQRLRTLRQHETNLTFVGMVVGHVHLYR